MVHKTRLKSPKILKISYLRLQFRCCQMRCFLILLFVSLLVLVSLDDVKAQKKPNDPEAYFPTENVNPKNKDDNTRENIPRKKIYNMIYKNSSEGTLYGNPCATEATMDMGFIYVVQPKGVPGSIPWHKVILNNLWVSTKLVFTKSPFWKLIIKKRIKECRQKSGDIVG